MAGTPLFAPYLVPLAMEKLSSSILQAKEDSLAVLGRCAGAWGHAPLAPHLATLWAALRGELLAPAADGVMAAEVPAAAELADRAAACLTDCTKVCRGGWCCMSEAEETV